MTEPLLNITLSRAQVVTLIKRLNAPDVALMLILKDALATANQKEVDRSTLWDEVIARRTAETGERLKLMEAELPERTQDGPPHE